MNLGRNHRSTAAPIYLKPSAFADHLSVEQDYYLFLDIDGTLAPFTLDPKDSVIPNATLMLLKSLQDLGANIAIVTGRSFAEAKQMLSPVQLPIAATHGLEIAADLTLNSVEDIQNQHKVTGGSQLDKKPLNDIKHYISKSCLPYPDFIIEDKPYSVALHYRQNPALADVAYSIMSKAVEDLENWQLKSGKYVWEAVPKGADKGTAILTLINDRQNSHSLVPIFIGDDITDEAGFMAVQSENSSEVIQLSKKSLKALQKSAKGIAIKVGSEATCARYYVNNIDEVTILLESLLSFYQSKAGPTYQLQAGPTSSSFKTLPLTPSNSSISSTVEEIMRPLT